MTRTVLFASVVWVHLAASAAAQSADTIVDRHVNALGGKRALEQIVSSIVSGTVTLADGRSEAFVQETKRPNRLHIRVAWSSGRWSTGFNGQSVWQDDARDGVRTLMGRAAAQVRADAAYAARGIFPAGGRRRLTLVGKDQGEMRALAITVKEIAHNAAIDDRVFDFPQPSTAPRISVVELRSSVMRNHGSSRKCSRPTPTPRRGPGNKWIKPVD
jgi:hypothetical protein